MAVNNEPEKPIADLTQKVGLFGKQESVLYADRIEIRYQSLWNQWRHRVLLHGTKERLDYICNPVTFNSVLAVILSLGAGLVFWPVLPRALSLLLQFFHGRKGMYVLAYANKMDQLGRPMNVPMFFLPADNPSPQSLQTFLAAHARAHKAHMRKIEVAQSQTHYITEIKQFHELKQEGVIAEEEFAAVKSELLGMRQKKLGF